MPELGSNSMDKPLDNRTAEKSNKGHREMSPDYL